VLFNYESYILIIKKKALSGREPMNADASQGSVVHVGTKDIDRTSATVFFESAKERVNGQTEEKHRASSAHVQSNCGLNWFTKMVQDFWCSFTLVEGPLEVIDQPSRRAISLKQMENPDPASALKGFGKVNK